MTPENWADELTERIHFPSCEWPFIRKHLAETIRAAVTEEREAIKKLVAMHLNDGAQTGDGISADRTAASILYEIEQRSGVPTYDPVEMPK